MLYTNPQFRIDPATAQSGSVSRQAPSNIALVKYWGKHGVQLPQNPNLSFTLSTSRTVTELAWAPRAAAYPSQVQLRLFFAEEEKPDFAARVRDYFTKLLPIYPFIAQLAWTVRTHNTFPHGAGIASSASAMAALASCLVSLEEQWFAALAPAESLKKMSYLARLGSGSACRSVFPKAAAWGASPSLASSSDAYAVPVGELLHEDFMGYQDTILLVSEAEKSVSSSAGHGLMKGHAYAKTRYALARRRFTRLLDILRGGELADFCTLVEAEAFDLHALMMQSVPPYVLMEPATLAVIQAVRRFRQNTGLPVCFTLDAGPNVHLLYPKGIAGEVDGWLEAEVGDFVEGGLIRDGMG